MNTTTPKIGIITGSTSDLPIIQHCITLLDEFALPYELHVMSAHRTPQTTAQWATDARKHGIQVIIAAAGMAAHLAGVIAGHTILPVIAVPLKGGILDGMDALLATVQMPKGVPVATMSLGKSGAINAALFAVQILARNDTELEKKLESYKLAMADAVAHADDTLQKKGITAFTTG